MLLLSIDNERVFVGPLPWEGADLSFSSTKPVVSVGSCVIFGWVPKVPLPLLTSTSPRSGTLVRGDRISQHHDVIML